MDEEEEKLNPLAETATDQERDRWERRWLAETRKSLTTLDYDPNRDEPAVINFDQFLLEKIDAAAQANGVTRDVWISAACLKVLEQK